MNERQLPALPTDFAALLAEDRAVADPTPAIQRRVLERLAASVVIGGGGGAGGAAGGAGGGGAGAGSGGGLATTGAVGAAGTAGLPGSPLVLVTIVLASVATGAMGMHAIDRARDGRAEIGPERPAEEVGGRGAPVAPLPPVAPVASVAPLAPLTPLAPVPSVPSRAPAAPQPASVREALPSAVTPVRARPARSAWRPAAAGAEAEAADVAVETAASFDDERHLLLAGQAALARGDAPGALATVAEYSRDFPTGQLTEEVAALEVLALARTTDTDDTRTAGERFLRWYPASIHRTAVEAVLAALP